MNEPGPERAVVFQHHSLFPWLTAYQNVELAVKQVFKGKKSKAQMKEWIEEKPTIISEGKDCFIKDIEGIRLDGYSTAEQTPSESFLAAYHLSSEFHSPRFDIGQGRARRPIGEEAGPQVGLYDVPGLRLQPRSRV